MPGTQVARRWVMVAVACAYVGVLGVLAFVVATESSSQTFESSSADRAYVSTLTVTLDRQTLWQAQGLPVAVIFGVLCAACLVAAASLAWRISHGSVRVGVSALVAAGVLGALSLVGLRSIGIFLVPVVVLVALLARPLAAPAAHLAE